MAFLLSSENQKKGAEVNNTSKLISKLERINDAIEKLGYEKEVVEEQIKAAALPVAKEFIHLKRYVSIDPKGYGMGWLKKGISSRNIHIDNGAIEIGFWDRGDYASDRWFECKFRLPIYAYLLSDTWKEDLHEKRREWLKKKRENRKKAKQKQLESDKKRLAELIGKYGVPEAVGQEVS